MNCCHGDSAKCRCQWEIIAAVGKDDSEVVGGEGYKKVDKDLKLYFLQVPDSTCINKCVGET